MTLMGAVKESLAGMLLPFAIRRMCVRRACWEPSVMLELGDDWIEWTEHPLQSGPFEPCPDDIVATDWELCEHPLAKSMEDDV